MRTIATAAGLTPGALYWHFPSKEAILYAITLSLSDDWHERLTEVAEAPTPEEKVRRYIRAQISWELELADEGHALLAVYGPNQLMQFLSPEQRAFISGRRQEHFECLESFIRDGMVNGSFRQLDVTTTAHAIYDMGAGVVSWWKPGDRLDVQALSSIYEELCLHILKAS
jgi:AcrR family transcriptional regulator